MIKIAIPTDDRHTVAQHFGRATGFLVFHYDGVDLDPEYRSLAEGTCCGGGERHQKVVDAIRDCDVVIAAGMGGPMLNGLYEAGLEVALSTVSDARQAAQMLVEDVLPTAGGTCAK